MRRAIRNLVLLATTVAGAGAAQAQPPELRGLVGAARPAGCSDYRFLFWEFYRAELWSDAERLPGDAFALSLTYRASFSRDELVDSSITEMARIAGRPEAVFVQTRREMAQAFANVSPGDRVTAWRDGPAQLRLFVNGRETGVLTSEVDLFLAIWLGEATRHPKGRAALLAGRCDG